MKGMIILKKKIIYFLFIIITFLMFTLLFYSSTFAAWGDPAIVSKINSAFENIKNWLIKLSTPAAAVAVGTGVFMKKFSFGDEEKIRTSKKVIRGSLFSYGFILVIDLVLSLMQTLLK